MGTEPLHMSHICSSFLCLHKLVCVYEREGILTLSTNSFLNVDFVCCKHSSLFELIFSYIVSKKLYKFSICTNFNKI